MNEVGGMGKTGDPMPCLKGAAVTQLPVIAAFWERGLDVANFLILQEKPEILMCQLIVGNQFRKI